MKHPTDRELFSDIGPKGILEWSEKNKTEKTAAAAYAEALQKWKEKQGGTITIRYRPVRSYDDPTKNDVIESVDLDVSQAFDEGLEAAVQVTEATGRIGGWPSGCVRLGEVGGKNEDERVPLEVDVKTRLQKITMWDAWHLDSDGTSILSVRKDAKTSRKASFFVMLHLLMLCYSAAMVLMPQLHLRSWVGTGFRNWIVIIATLGVFGIGWRIHEEDGGMNWFNAGILYMTYYFLRQVCTTPGYAHLNISALVAIGLSAFTLIRYIIDGWFGFRIRQERKYIREFEERYQHAYRKTRFVALWQQFVLGEENEAIEKANEYLKNAREHYQTIKNTRI